MNAPKIKRYTPASGDTVTMENFDGRMIVIIAPADEIAALTLVWPTVPQNGDVVEIYFTKKIGSISHSGATLGQPCASAPANTAMSFMYDLGGLTFMFNGIMATSPIVSLPFAASVAGGAGNAVFYPTSDLTSGGTALFASIDFINAKFDDGDPNFGSAKPVVSNSNKTVTIACKKQTFTGISLLSTNILGSVAVAAAPNATALSVLVTGKLA